jgi:thiamine monophosphate synthase
MGAIVKEEVDYSIYLVTDSRLLSASARSFENHIEELIKGGVMVVQLRKTLLTADFIKRGKRLLEINHLAKENTSHHQ